MSSMIPVGYEMRERIEMKYGKILHNYGEQVKKNLGYYNLGDAIQTIGIEYIYKKMGIEDEQIVEIEVNNLKTYEGEYVLLPMYSVAVGIGFAELPLSPKIIPLFISTHVAKNNLNEMEISYLRQYAPIGCRDEYTLQIMKKNNILAYLSGCLTAVMPKLEGINENGKVFFVDVPEKIFDYIPTEIKSNMEITTHMVDIPKRTMKKEDAYDNYNKSKKQLEKYYKQAKMVVASKQHALIPCLAAGIPVVAVVENISQRFSWFDKYIKIYSENEFQNIDWNPKPVEYEYMKERLFKLFSTQIRQAYEKYSLLYEISDFYENREKSIYGSSYRNKIKSVEEKIKKKNSYVIWGCGLIGNTVYDIMTENYPDLNLKVAVDNFVTGTWHDVDVVKATELEKYTDSFIILATYSGKEECIRKMRELKLVDTVDYVYLATQNG